MVAAENYFVSGKTEAFLKVEIVGAGKENFVGTLGSSNPLLTVHFILVGRTLITAGASELFVKVAILRTSLIKELTKGSGYFCITNSCKTHEYSGNCVFERIKTAS